MMGQPKANPVENSLALMADNRPLDKSNPPTPKAL
jgi:hypothetical protein